MTGFDHHSEAHAQDPVASYRRQRRTSRVAWTDAHGGYWVVTGWDAVSEVATDDATFSSARHPSGGDGLAILIPKSPVALHIPIELDPPEFGPYRKVLTHFTKTTASRLLHPMIERYTTTFIDNVIESGSCDLASVIEVSAVVTIDWLGLDASNFKWYSSTIFSLIACHPQSAEYAEAARIGLPRIEAEVRRKISGCREEPTDDLITELTQVNLAGRLLTDDEVYSMAELLISGGVGTTASLIGQALVWLSQNPIERQRLIEDPRLLDAAIEEFLRMFSPTQALARTVTRDVEFHSCQMRAGDRVLISWASANRDEEKFEAPDTFDPTRWPREHVGFGLGIHLCAGRHLARAMSRSVIGQVLERMPDYEVDVSGLERYPDQGVNAGWTRIPTRFTPGPRRADRDVSGSQVD